MGNSSSKDSHSGQRQAGPPARSSSPTFSNPARDAATERFVTQIYGPRDHGGNSGRGSRHDLSFLHIGGRDRGDSDAPERPRETKQEREARRAERERKDRAKERDRSMKEENVDGGFLVTLGVYTGTEDYSKGVVRQLQIERRLAPFWKGLNDHSDSWAEHQLVAAARGLPIPAADEVPPDMVRSNSGMSDDRRSEVNLNNLTIPISSRSQSYQSDRSANLSASHPAFSLSGSLTPTTTSSTGQLFRGRAKTLASLASGNKSSSTSDLTPQETRLPHDPYVNGLPIEAYLYREVLECPICFMYYPPHLNKTRCCDQPICSECFVQIKRPDPHPPEHEQPGQQRAPEEEADLLVSEIAACPFCVAPEFGVTYDPPPFRRGLAYAQASSPNPFRNATSATSSQTSLHTMMANRRRTTSLSASAPSVITTDRVRPDWASKLADARAHALRRSAAATALHNAAYVLGNVQPGDLQARGLTFGRRRRTLFGDSPSASGSGTPREPAEGTDLYPGRGSSRRARVEDIEELMMMEAIRLSLAAEDDRKRRDDKEMQKEHKKKAKEAKKEAKAAEKIAKKAGGGSSTSLYPSGTNDSVSTWASTSMARSTSNLGQQPMIPEEEIQGKGKAPVQDFAGYNPLTEPTSTLNTELGPERQSSGSQSPPNGRPRATSNPQRHLEESRAMLQPSGSSPIPMPGMLSHHRQLSSASSVSSYVDSTSGSLRDISGNPSPGVGGPDVSAGGSIDGTPTTEPMLNFRSLAAMIGAEDSTGALDKPSHQNEHLEHASPPPEQTATLAEPNRPRGDSGESSASAPPPIYVEESPGERLPPGIDGMDEDEITPAPRRRVVGDVDSKHAEFSLINEGEVREAGL
nr:hypothetical protein B0A51_15202 [Rachicladosporium sp. CCFEE 5018]